MTDTVKTVATPMSRTSPKMGNIRRSLKELGFEKVILNQSKGREHNFTLRGKVSKDYVEFFSIRDIYRQRTVDDPANSKFFKTFGFNYNYIGLPEENHTVEINYQEKTSTFDTKEEKYNNIVTRRLVSDPISMKDFQKILDKILERLNDGKGFETPYEFLNFAIDVCKLQEEDKE